MMDQTFGELKQKGTFGQIKHWCKCAKFYYGWSHTAYSVYSVCILWYTKVLKLVQLVC